MALQVLSRGLSFAVDAGPNGSRVDLVESKPTAFDTRDLAPKRASEGGQLSLHEYQPVLNGTAPLANVRGDLWWDPVPAVSSPSHPQREASSDKIFGDGFSPLDFERVTVDGCGPSPDAGYRGSASGGRSRPRWFRSLSGRQLNESGRVATSAQALVSVFIEVRVKRRLPRAIWAENGPMSSPDTLGFASGTVD